MKKIIYLSVLVMILSGCYSLQPMFKYDYAMVKPTEQDELQFTDDNIDVFFVVGSKQVSFILLNRLEKPIKIDWPNVMLTIDGDAKRVMHSGVKYIDRNETQAATTVPPGAKIEDILMPTENVYYVTGQYGGWREHPLFPNRAANPEELEIYKGSELGIYFPVIIDDKTVDYNFKFKVTNIAKAS